MLLKYFYDQALAHASYLVGCQRAGEALIVDPGRDVEQYVAAARSEGLRITAVAETHIHADYVSGARELAARLGAKLFVSDEGPQEWKYLFADQYDTKLLKDGDQFRVGKIKLEVLHTPGHTPESISFVLTDEGGGASEPMGIFTGDFVFVGSIGRPDLLEEAAGVQGSAEVGARELFASTQRFKQLPDFLQVWPAHGAGSACGKGLGAIPSSTVGYEKLFNPALQFDDERQFVEYILADQPDAPKYFTLMKRVNKEGPQVLGDQSMPSTLAPERIENLQDPATVIDLSPAPIFAEGHVPGSINIPLPMLAGWAGWLLDYTHNVYLIASPDQVHQATRVLQKIGVDQIEGVFDFTQIQESGLATERLESADPSELADRVRSGEVRLLDVRSDAEWAAGRIPSAEHCFLGRLPERMESIDDTRPIVTQCLSGGRSAIAASLFQMAGKRVINMLGGYAAWTEQGLPTTNVALAPDSRMLAHTDD